MKLNLEKNDISERSQSTRKYDMLSNKTGNRGYMWMFNDNNKHDKVNSISNLSSSQFEPSQTNASSKKREHSRIFAPYPPVREGPPVVQSQPTNMGTGLDLGSSQQFSMPFAFQTQIQPFGKNSQTNNVENKKLKKKIRKVGF
ncbi:hypothetical protein BB561_001861 [Smittium simulii]|uniref:Uncharacterized protein n=1 Tax=Smittium simulii TaxID=133385 RepID=A0A2T9YSQ7_9FUNG|nr:hypothetical protein BB561_001861 [Smittium simulii]